MDHENCGQTLRRALALEPNNERYKKKLETIEFEWYENQRRSPSSGKVAGLKRRSEPALTSPAISRPDTDIHKFDQKFEAVPIFFGTNRVKETKDTHAVFGSRLATELALGRAVVTIPSRHRIEGGIDRPSWWDILSWRNPFKESREWHFTIEGALEIFVTQDEFAQAAARRQQQAKSFGDHAFVFVHGYNVTFENALYRTAQLAYDLGFDGAPYLFSWPSSGGVEGYLYDSENARLSEAHLRQFLESVFLRSSAKSIHLIAHSLGTAPLVRVLHQFADMPPPGLRLTQIILAAPDVNRGELEGIFDERGRQLY